MLFITIYLIINKFNKKCILQLLHDCIISGKQQTMLPLRKLRKAG